MLGSCCCTKVGSICNVCIARLPNTVTLTIAGVSGIWVPTSGWTENINGVHAGTIIGNSQGFYCSWGFGFGAAGLGAAPDEPDSVGIEIRFGTLVGFSHNYGAIARLAMHSFFSGTTFQIRSWYIEIGTDNTTPIDCLAQFPIHFTPADILTGGSSAEYGSGWFDASSATIDVM